MWQDYHRNNIKLEIIAKWKAGINLIKFIKQKKQEITLDADNVFYLVLDRDPLNNTKEQFQEIQKYCEDNDVKLIISNRAFELWYLLHYEVFSKEGKTVEDYMKVLSKKLWYVYKKKSDIYFDLKDKIPYAIKNAKALKIRYWEEFDLINSDPFSNVYEMVEDIDENLSQ
jgi:hypothetical protein